MLPRTGCSGRSAAVRTAMTPGNAAALLVSIDRIRACACGLRLILPHSIPAARVSAANSARPVTLSTPSGRIGLVPTTLSWIRDSSSGDFPWRMTAPVSAAGASEWWIVIYEREWRGSHGSQPDARSGAPVADFRPGCSIGCPSIQSPRPSAAWQFFSRHVSGVAGGIDSDRIWFLGSTSLPPWKS